MATYTQILALFEGKTFTERGTIKGAELASRNFAGTFTEGNLTIEVTSVSAIVGGIGLTISSAWLITMASQHPPILVLSVSIVLVRFFGISRSVARYAERIVSHESVFRRLTDLRVKLFEKLADRTLLIARDLNSGNYVKAIVDDVERAQEYQLRVTLPLLS